MSDSGFSLGHFQKAAQTNENVLAAGQLVGAGALAAFKKILPVPSTHESACIVLAVAATMSAVMITAGLLRAHVGRKWIIRNSFLPSGELLLTSLNLAISLAVMIISMAVVHFYEGDYEPPLRGDIARLTAFAGFYFSVGTILFYSIHWVSRSSVALAIRYSRQKKP